jgi:hypothetical protein
MDNSFQKKQQRKYNRSDNGAKSTISFEKIFQKSFSRKKKFGETLENKQRGAAHFLTRRSKTLSGILLEVQITPAAGVTSFTLGK